MNTKTQVEFAERTIAFYAKEAWQADAEEMLNNEEDILCDLMTDLRHYCRARGIAFNDLVSRSYEHYREEK